MDDTTCTSDATRGVLTPEDRQLPDGRLRKELEGKKRCCANCDYASRPCGWWLQLVLSRFAGLLICANSADAPGELRGVPPTGVCRNFLRKRPALVRTEPPEPPPGVCYIPLTQGQYAIIDAEDYERVSRYKWCLSRTGNQLYAYRKDRRKSIRMHQFIMNPPKGMVVDHIDGNGLNNRRCNLRICTQRQNVWNQLRKKDEEASSQYTGVHQPRKQPGKWYMQLKCGDDYIKLGPFDDEIEAARTRDHTAVEYFGPYAALNLPEEWPPERRKAVMEEAKKRKAAQAAEKNDPDTDSHGFPRPR